MSIVMNGLRTPYYPASCETKGGMQTCLIHMVYNDWEPYSFIRLERKRYLA